MSQVIDELVTILTFEDKDASREALEEYKEAVKAVGDAAWSASKWIFGLGASIAATAKLVGDSVGEMYEWSKANGVSTDSLQRLGYMAEQFGGSIDDVKSDLASLAMQAKARGMDVEDVLVELSESVQGLDAAQQKAALSGMVSSEALIRAMQAGPAEMRKLAKEAYVVSADQAKSAYEFVRAWRGIVSTLKGIFQQAASVMIPIVTGIVETFKEFFDANQDVIKSGLVNYFKAVTIVLGNLIRAVLWLAKMVATAFGWIDKLTFGMGSFILALTAVTSLTAAWAALLATKAIIALKQWYAEMRVAVSDIKKLIIWLYAAVKAHYAEMKATVAAKWAAFSWTRTWQAALVAIFKAIGAIVSLTAALIAKTVALVKATIAQWALNSAVLAFPGTWIVVAILAVVAALAAFVVWTESGAKAADWLGNAVKRGWSSVKETGSSWLKEMIQYLKDVWTGIKAFYSEWQEALSNLFAVAIAGTIDRISNAIDYLRRQVDRFNRSVNTAIDSVNNLLSKIPGVAVNQNVAAYGPNLAVATPFLASGGMGAARVVNTKRQVNINSDQRRWYINNTNNISEAKDAGRTAAQLSKIPASIKAQFNGRK